MRLGGDPLRPVLLCRRDGWNISHCDGYAEPGFAPGATSVRARSMVLMACNCPQEGAIQLQGLRVLMVFQPNSSFKSRAASRGLAYPGPETVADPDSKLQQNCAGNVRAQLCRGVTVWRVLGESRREKGRQRATPV